MVPRGVETGHTTGGLSFPGTGHQYVRPRVWLRYFHRQPDTCSGRTGWMCIHMGPRYRQTAGTMVCPSSADSEYGGLAERCSPCQRLFGQTVVLLDWRRGEQLAVLPGVVVAASDDGKILAVASDTQPVMLQLWDVGTMRLLASRNVAQNILGMGFLSGGKGLVTVGNPETLVVWRILR